MICYSFLLKIMLYIPAQGYPQWYIFHVPVLRDISTIIYSTRSHHSAFPNCSPLAALEISVLFSDHFSSQEIGPQCSPLSVPLAKGSQLCYLVPELGMRSAQWLSSFIGIVQKRELEIKEWRDLRVPEGNKLFKYGDFVVVPLYHWWNLLHISNNRALFWGWWLFWWWCVSVQPAAIFFQLVSQNTYSFKY